LDAFGAFTSNPVDPARRVYAHTETMYDVFRTGAVDGKYVSEDFRVCRQLREPGLTIHVTDAVRATHFGMHGCR